MQFADEAEDGPVPFWVDLERLRRTVERIFRGIHLCESGKRLEPEREVKVRLLEDIESLREEARSHMVNQILLPIMAKPLISVGNGEFVYRFAQVGLGFVLAGQFLGYTTFLALSIPSKD
ncbi:MAG: hypothetical protein ACM3S1_15420 [Hyphomicrobiales bacterium]